ncbi:MAG: RNA polymerase sigma-54 factor, partial [Eubacteriaceae bacterium]
YRKYLSHPEQTDEATRAYLKQRLDSASLLIKNINSRRETVRNIITVIAEYQKPFFLSQEKYKRAMSLKLIADSIGMHESTVSRAIRGKFIQTPRGVFELKSFLEHGYSQSGGDVSASCIKGKIAELIQAEDSSRPLSDQKIADSLAEEGFAIARRTIAKYREALGIPVASKRKY